MIPNKNKKMVSAQPRKQKKVSVPKKRKIQSLQGLNSNSSLADIAKHVGGRGVNYMVDKIAALNVGLEGVGDYTINSNSLTSGTPVPTFRNGRRCTVIKHREYICDITSGALNGAASGFNIQVFPLNPGLSSTFSWLSGPANFYEQYRFHGAVAEFKSTAGSAVSNTNNALGTVIMATDYNVNNPPFISKQQMEDFEFADSCKPSESFLHPIECAPLEQAANLYYIRDGAVAVGDMRLNDLGNFSIATQGMQAANINIGELWITYEVELYKPSLPTQLSDFAGQFAHLRCIGYTNTVNLGTGYSIAPTESSLNVSLGVTTNIYDTLFLPIMSPGQTAYFYVALSWYGGATAWTAPTLSYPNSALITTTQQAVFNGNANASETNSGTTSANAFYITVFKSTAAVQNISSAIKFASGTLPTAGNQYLDIWVFGLPGSGLF
jgi:hypothetical protein